jgi:hypothetical protein
LRVAIPRAKSLTNNTELIVQPSPGPRFESAIEHRCFLVFKESAASQLTGYYESSVWDCVILQACHEEQWAMNVVVAIGALHHHQVLSSSPTGGPGEAERERKSHYLFALQQYGTALEHLTSVTRQELQSEPQLRHALIAALLTTCFETYIGDRCGAITQAKAGIDLLLKWTEQKVPADDSMDDWTRVRRATTRSLYLNEDLLGVFHRLDYQLLLCIGNEPDRRPPQSFPLPQQPFASVSEACNFWDLVVRRVLYFHFIKNVTEQHYPKGYEDENASTSGTSGTMKKVYPKRMLIEKDNFNKVSEQFFRNFDPVFKASRQQPGSKDYLLANLVMVRALACRAAISRGPSESEMYTDSFLRDFMLMVELARDLVDYAHSARAIFNFEITLGISLFRVAYMCRDPKVRRSAIGLLNKFSKPEAWFDTLIAAKIATWVVHKEEEGMVNGFIPDTARVRLVKHESGPQKQWAKIYCSKLVWRNGIESREALPEVLIQL